MPEKLRTPDAPAEPVTYEQVILTMPANADLQAIFWGSISAVLFHTAFVEYGSLSPEDTAFYMKAILRSRKEFNMLGVIVTVIRETLQSSMLLCDGSVYNKEDYPELWEVWPESMKDAISLTLPDLRNLFLVGAGLDYELGDTGGADSVTLTVEEIPAHSHSTNSYTPNIDVESAGVPDPLAIGLPEIPDLTGETGGGEAHENRPPYYAVVYAVIAKVQA